MSHPTSSTAADRDAALSDFLTCFDFLRDQKDNLALYPEEGRDYQSMVEEFLATLVSPYVFIGIRPIVVLTDASMS
jgi:hypothetical protein